MDEGGNMTLRVTLQIQVPVHRLKHALELVKPAVARRKLTMPILTNVLFRGGKLRATNLELSVSAALAETSGDAFTLPYKTLTDMLRHIPNAEVATLEHDGGKVILTSGGTRVTLFSTDAGEFPPLHDIQGEGELADGDRFLRALLGAVPYTAGPKEAARPVLRPCASPWAMWWRWPAAMASGWPGRTPP
jgi:DNA polymerase III sliding clamp (beta) subunit (PCNA family)